MSNLVITGYDFSLERQKLIRPFHFKGGFFTEKWINIVRLRGDAGTAVGLGGNAVLWSDPAIAQGISETGGNALMTLVAEEAVIAALNEAGDYPIDIFRAIEPFVHQTACRVAGRPVTRTFSLNAMVALDFALWKLASMHHQQVQLRNLLPESSRRFFSSSASSVERVPLLSYTVGEEEILSLLAAGHRVLKIKIGHAGDQDEMLSRDCRRLTEIHRIVDGTQGDVRYYLDANGRYEEKDTVMRLLDHADRGGMLERIILLEEPFPYDSKFSVAGIPVRVAADESLHSAGDMAERIDLGYGAVALKPAGKTLSQSILLAAEAIRQGLACFVADSACVPALVVWNLLFAAHLPPFPGLNSVLMESNGSQNYANWDQLVAELPESLPWIVPVRGRWKLDEGFFQTSGGVFTAAGHYESRVGQL